jgi:hypothetical protein
MLAKMEFRSYLFYMATMQLYQDINVKDRSMLQAVDKYFEMPGKLNRMKIMRCENMT